MGAGGAMDSKEAWEVSRRRVKRGACLWNRNARMCPPVPPLSLEPPPLSPSALVCRRPSGTSASRWSTPPRPSTGAPSRRWASPPSRCSASSPGTTTTRWSSSKRRCWRGALVGAGQIDPLYPRSLQHQSKPKRPTHTTFHFIHPSWALSLGAASAPSASIGRSPR